MQDSVEEMGTRIYSALKKVFRFIFLFNYCISFVWKCFSKIVALHGEVCIAHAQLLNLRQVFRFAEFRRLRQKKEILSFWANLVTT